MSEGGPLVNATCRVCARRPQGRLVSVQNGASAYGRTQTINVKVGLANRATRALRRAASMQHADAVPALGPLTVTDCTVPLDPKVTWAGVGAPPATHARAAPMTPPTAA